MIEGADDGEGGVDRVLTAGHRLLDEPLGTGQGQVLFVFGLGNGLAVGMGRQLVWLGDLAELAGGKDLDRGQVQRVITDLDLATDQGVADAVGVARQ